VPLEEIAHFYSLSLLRRHERAVQFQAAAGSAFASVNDDDDVIVIVTVIIVPRRSHTVYRPCSSSVPTVRLP